VETIVRRLRPLLSNLRLRRIEPLWPRTLIGDPEQVNAVASGRRIHDVFRRGKYICIDLDGPRITVHLRMSGRLVFDPRPESQPHIRARIHFMESRCLVLVDPRKFARIRMWRAQEAFLPRLGPEPLRPETVRRALDGLATCRAVKTALLDQHVLAGIGNIYADEALFRARIHPRIPARELTIGQRSRLSAAVPQVLNAAIRRKGTTLNDYRDPDQRPGTFQQELKVYGRTGQPCFTCGTPLVRIVVGQRGTHFCPKCQKA